MRKHRALLTTAAMICVASFLIAADAPTSQPTKTVTASGLTIIEAGQDDISSISTATAKVGDDVWVDYTGKLTDGTKFDSSADHPDDAIVFVIGHHKVRHHLKMAPRQRLCHRRTREVHSFAARTRIANR